MMYARYLISFLFLISLSCLSAEEVISFPTDEFSWKLYDPVLPQNISNLRSQNVITFFFSPNENNVVSKEMFKIKKHAKTLLIGSVWASNVDKIYTEKRTKDDCLIAFDTKDDGFEIDRFFMGKEYVYQVSYQAPKELVTHEIRNKWIKLCSNVTTLDKSNQNGWIVVSSRGIFQNGMPVPWIDSIRTYTDSDNGFSIEIPKSWVIIDKPQGSDEEFITKFVFGRTDTLAMGKVSIQENMPYRTYENFDASWKATIDFMIKKQKKDFKIISDGDIQNLEDLKGKFLVYRNPTNNITYWTVLYQVDDKGYKIDLWADPKNMDAMKDTFQTILDHFTIQLKNKTQFDEA